MLGITLGYVYERSGRLLPAILLHAIFNGVNLAVALS
jgi:membrane protease YdiL (CAAX protease family)